MHHFEENDLFDTTEEAKTQQKYEFLKQTFFGIGMSAFSLIGFVVLMLISLWFSHILENAKVIECGSKCSMNIVETIPHQIDLKSQHNSTFEILHKMITEAKYSIKICAFYWSLSNEANDGN